MRTTDAPGRRRSGRVATAVALAGVVSVGALALSACGGPTAATESTEAMTVTPVRGELVLEFDEGLSAEGDSMERIQSSGTATLRIGVSTAGGGFLERVEGRSGYAVRTPAFTATGKTPAAVLVIKPRGADQLSPGTRPVRWGIDMMLDEEQGDAPADNGDNLLQRGLFDHQAQIKLQIDHDVPSCRVRGSEGEALVVAETAVERGVWYRLACQLRGDELSLTVGLPGRPAPQRWSVPASVGSIEFRRSEPVAIGGKVDRRGNIQPRDTDQFNGLLDNVYLDISS